VFDGVDTNAFVIEPGQDNHRSRCPNSQQFVKRFNAAAIREAEIRENKINLIGERVTGVRKPFDVVDRRRVGIEIRPRLFGDVLCNQAGVGRIILDKEDVGQ